MSNFSTSISKNLKENMVVVFLVLLLVVEVSSLLLFVPSEPKAGVIVRDSNQEHRGETPILKLSDIRGSRIDDEAAMIAVEESLQAKVCFSLPVEVWVFLLGMFLVLLVFNLSYNFEYAKHIQWGWELGLFFLTFLVWIIWDKCHAYIWFPLSVMKGGLIIYTLYLYLYDKKKSVQREDFSMNV
jgi:hypothetical protein